MTVALGTVYLTGAGPGDPDLLTVRAQRLISTADAVFHDDLVPQSILQLCRPDTAIVSVGKRCGKKSITQEHINQALISAARVGKSVVRLKSGDPMLYGRATEELVALEREQIPYEVIPGVSALFAAAASMRVALTDRLSASRLIVLTGHRAAAGEPPPPLWAGVFPQDATIAIYMPGSDYLRLQESLLDSGLPRDTPCLIVSCAGTERQQSLQTSLAVLHCATPLPTPAILIVRSTRAPCSRNLTTTTSGTERRYTLTR
jgi:uroporphyrin-III C-methyltransferase